MRILIIGGSGFLSGTMARQALRNGHEVWVVTRGQRPLPEGVHGLQADRHDTAALAAAVRQPGQQFDLVVDCIAYRVADIEQDLALLPDLARHFVFISTDFVFDPAHRLFPQPAENQRFLRNDTYGAHKRRCEEKLLTTDCGAMTWTTLRACHIYGPGSQLGCLPCHSRDPELLARLGRGETLRLVGGGHYLQQPIHAEDLSRIALACPGAPRAHGRIFNTAGPDVVESVTYYEHIARLLGQPLQVEEVPVQGYREAHPEHVSFLCHRIYDLDPIAAAGLPRPSVRLVDGLRGQVEALQRGA